MKIILRIFLFQFLLVAAFSLPAQEICNNGIDDDGNGFIDSADVACNSCDSITQLNFDDGLLPSSHSWTPSFGSIGGSSIVAPGGNNMLNVNFTTSFVWFYDLGNTCLANCNWAYDIDFNYVDEAQHNNPPPDCHLGVEIGGCRAVEFRIYNYGTGFHHYHIEHNNGIYSGSIDGVPTPLTLNIDFFGWGGITANAPYIGFGNVGSTVQVQADNFSFFHCSNNCTCIPHDTVVACDSAQVHNNWYYSTQTLTDTLITSYGCDSIVITDLTINSADATFTGLASGYCADASSVALTANTTGGFFSGNGVSGSTFNPSSAIGTDTISYVLIDGNGCKDSTAQTTIVNPLPDATFSGLATSYCLNEAAVILTPVAAGGIFSGNGISGTSFNPQTAGAGNNTVSHVIIDGNGCKDSTAQTVIVHPLPDATFTGLDASYCSNTAIVTLIPVTPGGAFSGSGISGTTLNPAIANTGNDTIIYIVIDGSGCTDTTEQTTLILSAPTAANTFTNVLCNGDSTGTATVIASSGTGVYSYSWNSNPAQTTAIASGLPIGSYTCSVTDSNTCMTTTNVTITEPLALAVTPSQTDVTCNGFTNGSASVSITGGVTPYTYLWSPSSATNAAIGSIAAGNYNCTITDDNGCAAIQNITITQPDSMTAQITSAATCIINNGNAQVTNVMGGTGNYTYAWSPSGGTNAAASGLTAGTYSCLVTDGNNCTIIETIDVFVYSLPNLSITTDTSINYGSTVNLMATGGTTYLWTPTASITCNTCPSPIANPTETTTYCVMVTDTNSCSDSACVTITVNRTCRIDIPTAFSPNGDGANDLMCMKSNCVESVRLMIFDRWGEKVFETNDLNKCWDGTYRSNILNSAVFVYYLEAVLMDGSTVKQKGNISLIR